MDGPILEMKDEPRGDLNAARRLDQFAVGQGSARERLQDEEDMKQPLGVSDGAGLAEQGAWAQKGSEQYKPGKQLHQSIGVTAKR